MTEVSSSMLNPKYVGQFPFFLAEETPQWLLEAPPTLRSALWSYVKCGKRAMNMRMVGFCEPTLHQCVEELGETVKASVLGGQDPTALKHVLERRRGVVDVTTLPWEPRPEYVEWLRRQGRLAE